MNKRSLFPIFTLIFVFIFNVNAQVKEPQLSQKIDYLTAKYQDYRNKKSDILRRHGWDSKEMKDNEERVKSAFDLNYEAAKKIVAEYGFPSHSLVGEESSHNFWEMVQHFDHDVDFQMRVLRLMERALKVNDASPIDFAYLSDRVLLNMGRQQYYGTQLRYDKTQQTYIPIKVDNKIAVNKKRLSVGLPPLDESIAEMNSKYDGSVEQKPIVKKYHDTVGRPAEVIERLRNN